ncbi:hypothetical protein RYZ26_11975 [Terasakiella sp. A23]|nr:hypothetical protein [Terasakiella sp. A23]MDV7340316.1 hypothetical protein [Terasakiella sp. A23]
MAHEPTLQEKLTGDHLPFIIMGIGLFILSWLFFLGDLVMGR